MENVKQNKMADMPMKKLFWKMGLPMIISMVLQALYNVVDSIFVTNMGEQGAIANQALTLAFPIQILIIAIGVGTGIGLNTLLSKNLGENNKEQVNKVAGNGIFISICIFILFFLFGMFGSKWFISLFSAGNEEIISMGTTYLKICCCFSLGSIAYTAYERFLQATGKTNLSAIAQISGAIANIVLDYIFIFPLNMGVAGAAWATVIGQVVSGIMVILYLRKFKTVKLTKEKLRPHPHYIGRIVSLGMAPFFNQVSMMVVQIVMNNVLIRYGAKSSYGSDIPLACAGIITKINMIFFAINIGISQGLQPIISYNYGARKLDRVREAYLKAAISATIISTVSFICFQLFPRQIIGIFGSESEAYFRFAEKFFRIFLFCTFINGLQPITANFFTAIGKANRGIFLSLTRQVIFLLPLMIILPIFFGIEGVMFSAPIADGFAAVCAITFAVKELKSFQKL